MNFTKSQKKRFEIFYRFIPKGSKVLEIGNHDLSIKEYLRNCEYYAIDIKKTEDNIICDLNKDKIPFKNGFFDYVIFGEVIEHLVNLDNALKEISRVGRIIIGSTPNKLNLRSMVKKTFRIKSKGDGEHVITFSKIELLNLLKLYFKEVNIDTYFLEFKGFLLKRNNFYLGNTFIFKCWN